MRRFIFLTLIFTTTNLLAAPSVSGVSGTVTHGNTLTISGTSFSTRSPSSEIFDQLESGSFNAGWASTTNLADNTNNLRNSNAARNAAKTITSQGTSDVRFQASSTTGRDWFVSYWWKVSSSWDWGTSDFGGTDKFLSNIKIVRFWSPGSEVENIYCQYKGDNNQLEFIAENIDSSSPENMLSSARTSLTVNTWHQFRFQFRDSSAALATDGSFKAWFDGTLIYNVSSREFKEDESAAKRPFIIGFQNEWGCNEGTPDSEGCGSQTFYIDDVFMANSLARVEICPNSTYTTCTYTEPQAISSWADTSISITFNEGSLNCGSNNCYVYVTDNTGSTNTNGFLVTGGSSPSTETHRKTRIGGF